MIDNKEVVLDGTSDLVNITSRVPLGSILGPLLFNLVMNSISNISLSDKASLILYADDILLFKLTDSHLDVNQLQQDVNKILSWMESQGLTPNQSKTQILPITRSRNALKINIYINGHLITPST